MITLENVFVFMRNRGRQSGSTCKMGWQEKTEIFWDEKMVGVLSAGGRERERKLRSRSGPDLEGLQASKEHRLFLEGSKRTPVIFSRDWVHI